MMMPASSTRTVTSGTPRPQLPGTRLRLFPRQDCDRDALHGGGLLQQRDDGPRGAHQRRDHHVHNYSHNTRTPAHADAELRAPRDSAAARPLRLRAYRPDAARPGSRLYRHRPGQAGLFRYGHCLRGARHLRGQSARAVGKAESTPAVDMAAALERGLPVAIREPSAAQSGRHRGLRKARMARPQAAHLPVHPGARGRRRSWRGPTRP